MVERVSGFRPDILIACNFFYFYILFIDRQFKGADNFAAAVEERDIIRAVGNEFSIIILAIPFEAVFAYHGLVVHGLL